MSKKPENPPAFPYRVSKLDKHHEGMTLLDYFAAAALQGIIASSHEPDSWGYAERAQWAYANAIAMLAERDRRAAETLRD